MNTKGYSLTEILVGIGLLAIVGSIATIGGQAYLDTARENALKQAFNKIESAFSACMSFNGFKGEECNTFEKIGYKPSPKHKGMPRPGPLNKNICFSVKTIGKGKTRGCIQFENGTIKRKCLLEKPGFKPRCDQNHPGICCPRCSGQPCDVGTGGS